MSDQIFEVEFFGDDCDAFGNLVIEDRTVKVIASKNATDRDIRGAMDFVLHILERRNAPD
jgi:hypothetical protein|tara:strand:- start:899 stop:1078 length:180 start_codon:yes stop_codon:yes gene_type:complete